MQWLTVNVIVLEQVSVLLAPVNFSNGNDYRNENNWPDVNGNGNDGNFKNGNIIKTEMKTFKTYRNGNVRAENEKNANDVQLLTWSVNES